MSVPDSDAVQAQEVGALVMEAAKAELALRTCLVALLGSPYGEIIAAGRNVGPMIEECRELIKVHSDLTFEQRERGHQLLDELRDLQSIRNRLVHGLLTIDQSAVRDGGEAVLASLHSRRHKPAMGRRPQAVGDIPQVTRRFRAVFADLTMWTFENVSYPQQVLPPD